jgi:hypothetical protein
VKRLIEDIDLQFLERLRGAIDLLELLDNDRALLAELPDEERNRLHQVIAQIYNPDPVERRRKLKAAERERTAAQMLYWKRPASARCAGNRFLLRPTSFRRSVLNRAISARTKPNNASLSTRATATSASGIFPTSTIFMTNCVPRAPISTSRSARSWPICAAVWPC